MTEGRFTRSVIPDPEEVHRMLRVPDFHLGLLTCSLELVSAAVLEVSVLCHTLSLFHASHTKTRTLTLSRPTAPSHKHTHTLTLSCLTHVNTLFYFHTLQQHVLLSTPAKIGSEHSMLTVWHAAR